MRTVWLASYPKSGNTWFRIFLSNLLHPELMPIDPNQIPLNNLIASARGPFQEILGFPSSLLTDDESANLRPIVDEVVRRDWSSPLCIRKSHDAYTYLPDGSPLMGRGPNFAAIYILRNPADVAVSAASHWDKTPSEAVERLCRSDFKVNNKDGEIFVQFSETLLSWAEHAISWLKAPMDVHLMRYESMHAEPLSTFRSACEFLGLNHSDVQIEVAIEASSFSRLQKVEREVGFREAARPESRFFRKGVTGEGAVTLAHEELRKLWALSDLVEQEIASGSTQIRI